MQEVTGFKRIVRKMKVTAILQKNLHIRRSEKMFTHIKAGSGIPDETETEGKGEGEIA